MSTNNDGLITELVLTTGEKVAVNSRISISEFNRAQKEGLLGKELLNDMLLRRKGNSAVRPSDFLNAAFVCYRSAGGRLSKEGFQDVCPLDLEVLGTLYGQMLTGGKAVKKTQFTNAFESATKK